MSVSFFGLSPKSYSLTSFVKQRTKNCRQDKLPILKNVLYFNIVLSSYFGLLKTSLKNKNKNKQTKKKEKRKKKPKSYDNMAQMDRY